MTFFAAMLFLVLISFCCFNFGDCCTASDVFLRFRGQILQNNSYILYSSVGTYEYDRLFCYTNKKICCNHQESDWFFPNGERVLGAYEYDDIRVGVFARSSGFRLVGLYRHFNPQQRGRFSCVLPDIGGNNCTLFANIVDSIPSIVAQPVSQTVTAGQNVTFSIEVSNDNFATYRWQKDNMDIEDNPGVYEGTTSSMLTIFNVQEQEEGYYHCIIDNIIMSQAAELSVAGDTIIIQNDTTELNVISGHNLEFTFDTDIEADLDDTVTFQWQKDGHALSERHKYKGSSTQILTIIDVENSDEGDYFLIVTMADVMSSFNISISVVTPLIGINPSIIPEIGLQCNLTCTVTGAESYNLAITYQWFKDGVIISNATESMLTITSLEHNDAGQYMCVVNLTSEKLIPSFLSNMSNTYLICFTLDIRVTLAGRIVNNKSLIYYDEIGNQNSTTALACYINNIVPCGHSMDNSQIHASGEWYYPNGDLVPLHIATQTTSMFSQRSASGTELHRIGLPSQIGRYFCTAPNTSTKFYVFIRSHVSLSLRGVTIYNNTYLSLSDIGGIVGDEALQCHTDNINCCDNGLNENTSVLAEWYRPNGSKVASVDGIENSNNESNSSTSDGFLTRKSQSLIALFSGRVSSEVGHYCCKIQDQNGLNQTMCVNLVNDHANKTEQDMTCLQPKTQDNSDLSAMDCYSPLFEVDNVSIVVDQESADVGRSFSMSCTIAGINDSVSLSIAHQWYKDKHSIQGATLPTLHFGALKLSDIGSYVCEVAIRSNSQKHGIFTSSVPYILNISSTLFQIRLYSVQNCIQWTSSDVINRIEDIEHIIVSSLRKDCQCDFSEIDITDEGFQCFAGSESHVTFRARLKQTNHRSSLELMMYLEDIVSNARYWLVHGQYLRLNISCSLLITDIHNPECSEVENSFTTSPPITVNTDTAEQGILSSNVGYLTWALSSTLLLLILMTIFGVLLSVKGLKSKSRVRLYGHHNNSLRCNAHEINTGANNAYGKEEVYQEMKECSGVNDQYSEDDYEEIRNIGQKANSFN